MSAKNRVDTIGTFCAPFPLQKGKDLLIFNRFPTNPWSWQITDTPEPGGGPASVLISSGSIAFNASTFEHNFEIFTIDLSSTVLIPGQRYTLNILDNTLSVVDSGEFDIFDIDLAVTGGLAATINELIKVGLGLHGENSKLVNDEVRFGIPTIQTLTIFDDETLQSIFKTVDIRRYLDETNRILAEVSRINA